MKYIVNYSTGLASTEALERTIERYGKENTVPVFADVKGRSTEEHAGEDADSYRFMANVERYFGVGITRIVEGRDIWQVMFDERKIIILNHAQIAPCSQRLKREPIDAWVTERYTLGECVIVTGLGWDEAARIASFDASKAPYQTWHPLTEPPYVDNCHIATKWQARGIEPPKLYEDGFSHGNCGGFCVKAGQAHFARLYAINRERYMYHAAKEERFRREINPNVTILRSRKGGKSTPITLYEFAAMIDRGEAYDRDDWGGCGCFAPVVQGRMDALLLETDIH